MAKSVSNFRFSIIIPLEFHRGHVKACLQKWAKDQTYPRDQYEIVAIGCLSSLNEETISFCKSLLTDRDRLLLFDEPHDMALCVYGAKHAKGEILFFTESHVLPDSDLLSNIDQALNNHPDWAGFSCKSIRITPNRLSIIEADMYEADILYGMYHPWRKILDQCFAVRAESYHDAGGFRMELGHFAEWHLAAQLHQKGYQIGYVPEAQVHHYYVGDINELIEFTKDFTHGEMIYHSKFTDDECKHYFIEPLEWLTHRQRNPDLLSLASHLISNAHPKPTWRRLIPREMVAYLMLMFRLKVSPEVLMKLSFVGAYFRFQYTRLALTVLQYFPFGKSLLRSVFLQLIDATVTFERIRFIQNLEEKTTKDNMVYESISSLTWVPDFSYPYPSFGIHLLEEWKGQNFRWSEPVGIIELPLISGNYDLEIKWLSIRNITNLTLYINNQPIPAICKNNTMSMSFQVTSNSPTRFAWTCEPWLVPNDKRLLGIPITSISVTLQQ